MKCYSRYIVKKLAVAMFFVTFCMTRAAWLTAPLRYVMLMVTNGIPFGASRRPTKMPAEGAAYVG
jgi:hypothetical protein